MAELTKNLVMRLFNNLTFKKNYSNHVNKVMEDIYEPMGKWGTLLLDGNKGVLNTGYDLSDSDIKADVLEFYGGKDPIWSLLNYVNTNHVAFKIICDAFDTWVKSGRILKKEIENGFKFDVNNPDLDLLEKQWFGRELEFREGNEFEELSRVKSLLDGYGRYLFTPDGKNFFNKIMACLALTTYLGDLGEIITAKKLPALGEVTDILQSKPGEKRDTQRGVDITFKLNGVNKTLQCKVFRNYFFHYDRGEGDYFFGEVGRPMDYRYIDYFSFVDVQNKYIYIFSTRDNKGVIRYRYDFKIKGYIFDELLLKFKGKF